MSKTLGLALGAGGARGVAHAGFLQALEEEGIRPDYITGCSMGSVVGGCYASGMPVNEMREALLSLKIRDIFDLSPLVIFQMSLLGSRKMRELLEANLRKKNIEDFPVPFKCVATDLISGKLHVFDKGSAALAIQASSTIPSVFRPVPFEDKLFVDGSCLCRVPIKLVKDMGADVVVAVDVLKNTSQPSDELHNIFKMLLRVYDVMDANATSMYRERDGHLCDLYLEPEMAGVTVMQVRDLGKPYDEGYMLGKLNAPKIKELLK